MSLITDPLLNGAETREQTARIIKMLEDGGPKYPRTWYTYDSTKFLLRRALQATLHNSPDVWRKPESTHWEVPTYDFDRRMPPRVTSGVFDAEVWTWSRKYSGSRLWGLARSKNDGTLWLRYEAWCAVSEADAKASGIVHVHKYTHVRIDPGVRVILSDRFMHSVLDRAERYGVCQSRSVTEPIFYERKLPSCISIVDDCTSGARCSTACMGVPYERYVFFECDEETAEFNEMSADALQMRELDLAGMGEMAQWATGERGFHVYRGSVSRHVYLCWPKAKVRMRLEPFPGILSETYGLPLLDDSAMLAAVRISGKTSRLWIFDRQAKHLDVWGDLHQPLAMDVEGVFRWEIAREQMLEDWYRFCEPETSGFVVEPERLESDGLLGERREAVTLGETGKEDLFEDEDAFPLLLGGFDTHGIDGSGESDWDSSDDGSILRRVYHPGDLALANEYEAAVEWIIARGSDDSEVLNLLGFSQPVEATTSKWNRLYEMTLEVSSYAWGLENEGEDVDDSSASCRLDEIEREDSSVYRGETASTEITTAVSGGVSERSDRSDGARGEPAAEDVWLSSFWQETESDGLRVHPVGDVISGGKFEKLKRFVSLVVDEQIRVVSGAAFAETRFPRFREMYVDFLLRGDTGFETVWPLFVDTRAFDIFVSASGGFPYEPGSIRRMLMKVDVANANLWSALQKCHAAWRERGQDCA